MLLNLNLLVVTLRVSKTVNCMLKILYSWKMCGTNLAPGNLKHLSWSWRTRVGWAALNIEQSPHFDIRRWPWAFQPPPTFLFTSVSVACAQTNSAPSHIGAFCLLSFCQIVQESWYPRKDAEKGIQGGKKGRETEVEIMARTLEGLLTMALTQQLF